MLIASETGAILTDIHGNERLEFPLNTDYPCGYLVYANEAVRDQLEPVLLEEIDALTY